MSFINKILQVPLNGLAYLFKLLPLGLEYLANKPLRSQMKLAVSKANQYEHIEHAINIAQIHTDCTGLILDIGAATGHTASLFREALPNNKILAFEPLPYNFQKLLERKITNLIPINKGLGQSIGTKNINITNRITASSFLEINPKAEVYQEETKYENIKEIEISTLDEEISNEQILIIKVDVQGFELEVLRGGENCLKNTSIIILEVNNNNTYLNSPTYFEIDEFLRNKGFILFDLLPNMYQKGKLMDWDCIYIKSSLYEK